MDEFTFVSAFLLGLMGAPHCAGMCGGIIGTLSLASQGSSGKNNIRLAFAYNLGRMVSYGVAGTLIAGLSAAAIDLVAVHQAQLYLKYLAIVFMLLMGLYLGGWWPVLTRLEKLGQHVWRLLEPLGRRFIPVRSTGAALLLGAIWGWLPCGLVYTALIYSSTAGSAAKGGLLMICFAAGTLPVMLAIGAAGVRLQGWIQQIWLRRLTGLVVIGFAVHMAYAQILSSMT